MNKNLIGMASCYVGAALLAGYVYGYRDRISDQKEVSDSFLTQEQSQLEKELADCGNEFFTKIADIKENLGNNDTCKIFAKENDYKSHEWCLSREKYRRWTDCKQDAYQKSIERMKNYMKGQRK